MLKRLFARLVGLGLVLQPVATMAVTQQLTCVEIDGPFGQYQQHESLVPIVNSSFTVEVSFRQDGWQTKNVYGTTSQGLFYFGTKTDLE